MEMEDRKNDEASTSAPKGDYIQKIIGGFGKYQLVLCLLIFLSKFPIAWHQMAIIFLAPSVSYTCPSGTELCPCENPVYNTSVFTSTIITEWNLICGNRWLGSFNQTLFQLGTLLGSVLFGMAADRFGRKKPFVFAIMIQIAAGIGAAYANTYILFSILRFLIGISVGGTMVIGFVIIMEFVGSQYRDVVSALYQTPFNLGHMSLPVFGYFFRDFSTFQLSISVPIIILLCYICLVPETPRWLIAHNDTERAIQILEKVAKTNKLPSDNIKSQVEYQHKSTASASPKKGTLLDLFRTPNLRKNIIAMSLNWLSCSYCFYGVSQYVGRLSGNVFINVMASASVTLLGSLVSIPLMRCIGRRTILIVFNFICAGCLLLIIVTPEGPATVTCASIGVVSSFIVFVLVYLYCIELFPTVVRNAAIGYSSMMARVGSMVAPFIVDLGEKGRWLPPVAFAVAPLIAGCVAFLMPETKGTELMTTLQEGEAFGKKERPIVIKN